MLDSTHSDPAVLEPLKLEKIDQEKLAQDRAEVANILVEALQPSSPSVAYDQQFRLSPRYPDSQTGWGLLMKALGTSDVRFLEGVLDQLGALCQAVDPRHRMQAINSAWSIVVNLKPRNPSEALLIVQIAAVHLNT